MQDNETRRQGGWNSRSWSAESEVLCGSVENRKRVTDAGLDVKMAKLKSE